MTDVRFDPHKKGVLSFDINSEHGGAGVLAIKKALKLSFEGQIRVAIVRDMKSYYYLLLPAKIGDKHITVEGANVFSFSDSTLLGFGKSAETVRVISSVGNVATLAAPLTKNHAIGDGLEFPAAGWSSDPIIIIEGNATLDVAKWTVLHEVGHRALGLADIDDTTDFMNFQQSWTDYRLRYCPRKMHYKPGDVENQWEKIPRS